MEVTPSLKTFTEQKVSKLPKYFDRIQEIEVIFDNGKDVMRAEVIVNAEHSNPFVVHHDNPDAYAALDECMHKMERQLTDHKEKFRNRKHPNLGPARTPGSTIEAAKPDPMNFPEP